MNRFARLWILVLLLASLAAGQTATVKRNVNLRPDPSTQNDAIDTLHPRARLTLIEPDPTDGFYHVRTAAGDEGWVWGRNIKIKAGASASNQPSTQPSRPTQPSTPTTSGQPSTGQELFDRLTNAKKPATGQPLVENGNTVCGPAGDATQANMQELNQNKNRTDEPGPSDPVEVAWNDLENLPKDRVADFEGAPVSVVGFLSHKIAVENSGKGESTNCHLTGDDEVDWHMYLTDSPAQPIASAIIVETTPRVRPAHKWTPEMLKQFVDSNTQVRISGWLIYDFEHVNVIGKQRASVWEVHPITRIEVQQNGQWVDLDQQ